MSARKATSSTLPAATRMVTEDEIFAGRQCAASSQGDPVAAPPRAKALGPQRTCYVEWRDEPTFHDYKPANQVQGYKANARGLVCLYCGDRIWPDGDGPPDDKPPSSLPRKPTLAQLNAASDEDVRARHLIRLKSGRDEYSRMRRTDLVAALDATTVQQITAEVDGAKDQEVCMRWVLRGLRVGLAVRKARLVATVRRAAIDSGR